MRIKRVGNLTTDNECECDVKSGFWEEVKQDVERNDYELICWYKECEAGQELTENGQFKTGSLFSISTLSPSTGFGAEVMFTCWYSSTNFSQSTRYSYFSRSVGVEIVHRKIVSESES